MSRRGASEDSGRGSIFDRVAAYADDAAELVRGRRLDREPFARIHFRGGSIAELDAGEDATQDLQFAARTLLERTGEDLSPRH